MAWNPLTPDEKRILEAKETEPAFTGQYDAFYQEGTFICRRCNSPLFSSASKFDSGCGWPAFDTNYPNAILRLPDPDGQRTEIQCAHCQAHLGHVFEGEHFTPQNTRHCVNSLSLRFIPKHHKLPAVKHA